MFNHLQKPNLPIICYADKRVLHIDTVPYDMREFKTNMAVTTSPVAKYAIVTNMELYQQRRSWCSIIVPMWTA